MLDRLRLILQRRLDTLTGLSAPQPAPVSDPEGAERLRKQGNALLAEEKLDEAEACFREALVHGLDDTQSLVCLGYVLKEQGRLAEARITLKRAVNPSNTDPKAFEAHYLLGEISEEQGDIEEAKRYFKSTLDLKPDFTRACADLVRLLRNSGQHETVRPLLVQIVNRCPDCRDYRMWLAEVCADVIDYEATVEHLAAVIRLGGGNVRINITMGAALCRLDRIDEANHHFDQAAEADPTVAYEICYHQGYFHSRVGNSTEAVALLERAIELNPTYLPAHQMLLFNLCFAQPQVPGRYKEAVLRFNHTVRPVKPLETSPAIDAGKPILRVGFSCGEFRNHPVHFFLIGVLEHIDRSRFQLFAYSNNEVDDDMTQSFKDKMDGWHNIRELTDDAAAELIRSHQIDVLIDLCGHSGEARLPVFARRPAPVQATWLGYFASTGLDEMDFIIADPTSVPQDATEWFSEAIIRMPATRLCMTPPKPSRKILISPPPCVAKGYVTFGSFQQAAKITPKVLETWSQVMAQVPNSRLRIQSSAFGSAAVCERMANGMRAVAIDLTRVEMLGSQVLEDYLEAHNEVDILIDTFPYTGGTTTAFALWMGVPVLSMLGNTMLSRQGATMLGCVGLSDWFAHDEMGYVDKAVKFSADVQYLARLRSSLREAAEKSPLFDTKRFTGDFEGLLVKMCAQQQRATTL